MHYINRLDANALCVIFNGLDVDACMRVYLGVCRVPKRGVSDAGRKLFDHLMLAIIYVYIISSVHPPPEEFIRIFDDCHLETAIYLWT